MGRPDPKLRTVMIVSRLTEKKQPESKCQMTRRHRPEEALSGAMPVNEFPEDVSFPSGESEPGERFMFIIKNGDAIFGRFQPARFNGDADLRHGNLIGQSTAEGTVLPAACKAIPAPGGHPTRIHREAPP